MPSVTDILTTNILIPTSGSPSKLPNNVVAEKLEKAMSTDIIADLKDTESTYIKVNGGTSQKIIGVQSISEFGMDRQNEQKLYGDYVVNLPGNITYSDVVITHVFTRDKFFLDWLKTGINQCGVSKADIEIVVNIENKNNEKMVFTLYDAFPVKWELSKWLATEIGAANSVDVLMENVTITYSKVDFKLQKQPNN